MEDWYCFMVTVVTTNSTGSATKAPDGCEPAHIKCKEGIVYVAGKNFSCVEKLINPYCIISIENIGPVVVA